MVYKSFYFQIVFRILLILASGFLFIVLIDKPNLLYVQIMLVLATVFQTGLLIRFINKINIKLALFFEAVKIEDLTVGFVKPQGSGEFDELNFQLDQLTQHFKNVLMKREAQDEYFKAVIEHVGIGIFAFDEKGSIRFINSEALSLFGFTILKNIFALDKLHPDLSKFFKNLVPEQQQLLELKNGNEILQLAAKLTCYKIMGEALNLVSLQNIKPELDLKETETWQKMIRILAHEIINSVSPITSLANSLSALVKKESDIKQPVCAKLDKGLSTIKKRGEGMMEFVRKYRNLAILPLPQIAEVSVDELMNELRILFEEEFIKEKIEFKWKVEPENLRLRVDREQIEQVLINVVKNSIWAVHDQEIKKISIHAYPALNKRIHIEVKDSGKGLDDELLDKIFIPFFTTRSEGSGIGLSLARQIMLMHGGNISAHANAVKGSVFLLDFKAST